ncbi:MAG: 50S ribosomal protein L29 [Actinomycetia bacterium]|nr:50S ribosomal protein L29 [Actinomycetes bacterium]
MKAKEIRELSNDDLRVKLNEGRTELFNLRFQMATSQLDNTARIGMVKKDIARVLTEIREREMLAAAGANSDAAKTAQTA